MRKSCMRIYLLSISQWSLTEPLTYILTSLMSSLWRFARSSDTIVLEHKLRKSRISSTVTGKIKDTNSYQASLRLSARDLFSDHNDPIYDEVIQTVLARVGPCRNCFTNTSAGNCISPPYLDLMNFRPGALVINQPSELNTSELHQRVYRLGRLDPESKTFTSFDKFGFPLPEVELRVPYRDFLFNCSAGNADTSGLFPID